ncbi:MAG: hypothetical protein ABSC13_06245 [Dehalococcoidia bacterium]
MHELRIGDINRLTGRTTEAVRRAERDGFIPRAHRTPGGFRYWEEADLPDICEGLGVPLPPTPAEYLLHYISDTLGVEATSGSFDSILQQLGPMIAEQIEALLGDNTSGRALGELLGEAAPGLRMTKK